MKTGYELVKLANGTHAVHSLAHGETFHPAIGPAAEAESLYVNQLSLRDRLKNFRGEFVIWDVGLGAAANALTVLRTTHDLPCSIRLMSFDHTTAALEFALQHAHALGYFNSHENHLHELLRANHVSFQNGQASLTWEFYLGDFPSLLTEPLTQKISKPHAILFDPCSPKKNSEMWSLPLLTKLFGLLDPQRPCSLATYSRSTMTRVALLLAGFYVGVGHPTGQKEETTVAANSLDLIAEPLGQKWLARARASHSAEPLNEGSYRQAPLSAESWEKLRAHPQFKL